MKISVNNEPGFKQVHRAIVTMDGRRLARVISVDTCAGVAWVHDTNPDGTLMLNGARNSVVQRRILGPMVVTEIEP